MNIASPAILIARHLIDTIGLFSDPANGSTWPLYIASLPDGTGVENNAAAVYDSPGINDGRLMSGHTPEHRGVQFIIRFSNNATDYAAGFDKAESIKKEMDAIKNIIVVHDSMPYTIYAVSRRTPTIPMGVEEGTKRRQKFSLNFTISIKEM
jgi:hypothetical protein